jgi:hypothetical protein
MVAVTIFSPAIISWIMVIHTLDSRATPTRLLVDFPRNITRLVLLPMLVTLLVASSACLDIAAQNYGRNLISIYNFVVLYLLVELARVWNFTLYWRGALDDNKTEKAQEFKSTPLHFCYN